MARLASAVVLALLPIQAMAAEDAPLQAQIYAWLAVFFIGIVPAAGVGYVLGSYVSFLTAISLLAALALVPTVWLWIIQGIEQATKFAPLPFAMLLVFGPLIYLGWRLGRRDAIQQAAHKSAPANGA